MATALLESTIVVTLTLSGEEANAVRELIQQAHQKSPIIKEPLLEVMYALNTVLLQNKI